MVTTASSDFKTIKAKVGKRAPVKANVTDTSFKSAGLHISKQVGISNNNNNDSATTYSASSVTTRSGISIHQLLMQFKHPTIAVRISALKSFKNLLMEDMISNGGDGNGVYENHHSTTILQSYISDIVSSLLPICCIDDEINVRKLAIQIFYDIFLTVSNQSSSSSLLQPFTSYIIAMISTGLNSLDIQQQFDNAIMVRYLIEIISLDSDANAKSRNMVVKQAILQFIPPLTRLLGVVPNTTTATSATNKSVDPAMSSSTTTATSTSSWVGGNGASNLYTTQQQQQQQQHPMMIVGSMKKSKNNQMKKRKRQKVSLTNNTNGDNAITTTPNTTTKSTTTPHQVPPKMDGSSIHTNPKLIVLLSIYTLFRNDYRSVPSPITTMASNEDPSSHHWNATQVEHGPSPLPDVTILPHQLRRTAIVFIRNNDHSQYSTTLSVTGMEHSISFMSPNETLDLLVKVRDFMIEASQSNDSHSLLHCIMTVRYILEYYSIGSFGSADLSVDDESRTIVNQRCYKLCNQIGSYIVESFRMYSSNNGHDSTNNNMAVLSRSLLCLVNTIQPLTTTTPKNNSKQEKEISTNIKLWVQLITLHIQSTLEDDEATLLMVATDHQQMETDQVEMVTTKEMLSILTELLVRDDLRSYVTIRIRLIELFGVVFFLNDEMNEKNPQSSLLICSEVGRTAMVLCCRLVFMQQYDVERITQFFGPANTSKLLRSISYYMVHLRANYLAESTLCLSTLQHLLLRMNRHSDCGSAETNCYADMIPMLRVHMQTLLSVDAFNSDGSCSIFEMYPEALQRQFVCFCIMSNICTSSMIKLLANICAQGYHNNQTIITGRKSRVVSVAMASFIVQSVHSIRKAMPMTVYIGFLLDSTGVMALVEPTAVRKKEEYVSMVSALDQSLRSISSCLIGCGTKKVLPMLEPIFTVLLGNTIHDPTSIVSIIQARAVLCLLAIFCLDLQKSNVMDGGSQSIFHFTSSEFKALVVKCITCLLSTSATLLFGQALAVSVNRWLSPIVSIFTTDKPLFSHVLKEVLFKIPEFDTAAQGRIMDMWLSLLKELRITSILQSDGSVVMAGILNHAKLTDTNEANPVIKRLVTELQIRCTGSQTN